MTKMRFTLLWVFTFLATLSSFAQQNPTVQNPLISPKPIVGGVGSPYSMTFTVGNNGTFPIRGNTAGFQERMQFGLTLTNSNPATADPLASLSGPLITSGIFSYSYNVVQNTYEFVQIQGKALPANTLLDVSVNAVVTQLTGSASSPDDIGGAVNIAPNGNAAGPPDPTTGTGGNATGVDDFKSIYTRTTAVLPVSLVSFTAQAQENRTVLLNWSTSWERSNKGYVVERSKDLKNFEQVGEVNDVAGTSNSVNTYKFSDLTPYRGTSYYRLRQMDLDGSIHTYKAEPVVIDGRYGVYPNPVVSQQFTVDLDEPATALLRLYNASGSEIGLGKLDATEMNTKVTPAAKLTTGVYILTVEERGTTRKHRLVVQ